MDVVVRNAGMIFLNKLTKTFEEIKFKILNTQSDPPKPRAITMDIKSMQFIPMA